MRAINLFLNSVFGLLLEAPAVLFRQAGLVIVSIGFGLVMVFLFGRFSNQAAIRRTKNTIKAHLLSVSLYPHEIGLAFRTYGRIFRSLGMYLWLMLAPTLLLVVPFVLVAIQLDLRFGRRPLLPGEAVVVSAFFDSGPGGGLPGDISLEGGPAVVVETPQPVRIPSEGEVAWRVRPQEAGKFILKIRMGDQIYEKEVVVGGGVRAISAERPGPGLLAQLWNPVEPPIRDAMGPRAIRIEYPKTDVELLWWKTHWMVFFVLVSIVVAMIARVPLGVEV